MQRKGYLFQESTTRYKDGVKPNGQGQWLTNVLIYYSSLELTSDMLSIAAAPDRATLIQTGENIWTNDM
jgi:hypothetical protein